MHQKHFGNALTYLVNQDDYLKKKRLEMDNNRSERNKRPFKNGRRSFLFTNTVIGAQVSTVVYSLIERISCITLDIWFMYSKKLGIQNMLNIYFLSMHLMTAGGLAKENDYP